MCIFTIAMNIKMNKIDIQNPVLLHEFNDGGEVAFNALFRHFYPMLCLFAGRILADEQAAKDVAQEAMLKAWQMRQGFTTIPKLKSFLFTCVKNGCLMDFRKQKYHEKYQSLMQGADLDDQDALKEIIQSEVVTRIFSQVDTLPEQCRKVILMTFEEGKKPSQIAEEMGISVSTVNSQKMRGITLLRGKISSEDFMLVIALLFPGHWD